MAVSGGANRSVRVLAAVLNIGAWLAKSGLSDRLRLRVCLPLWALSAVLVLLAEEHSAAAYKMGLRPDTTVYTLLT